jgi:hypothetical protein
MERRSFHHLTLGLVLVLVLHGRKISGIEFVSGRQLRTWLREQQSAPCERSTAEALLRELETYRRSAARSVSS